MMSSFELPKITSRKLFEVDPTDRSSVTLGVGQANWYHFAHGYKTAADELVSRLNDRGVVSESICLPVLYLYRHYVELSLKALLIDLDEVADVLDELPTKHPLLPLWKRFRDALLELDPSQESEWLTRAEALIAELDELDRYSFAFRYPVTKEGVRSLQPMRTNIFHFRDVMRELSLVLEGAGGMLADYIDIQRDLESQYYDYAYYY